VEVVEGAENATAWDTFLAASPRPPVQQTTVWARVRASQGWRSARMAVKRDGDIYGGALLLYKSLPLVGAVGLVTRGPVVASEDPALVAAVSEGVQQLATACGVGYLVVQPPRLRVDVVAPRLLADGYRTAPAITAPHNTVTDVLDLRGGEEAVLAGMRKSTRRSVRLAQRRSVVVRDGGRADLPLLHSLVLATGRRRGFSPPPASFFETTWDVMAPAGMLRMGVAEVEGTPVSAFLWVPFGDTMNCWRGGWSGEHTYRRPNEALDWAGISWALEHGLRWYDFHSEADYMRGFGGVRETSPGPLEKVLNPWLRPLYPRVFQRVLDTETVSRLKQVVKSRGWYGAGPTEG
jgi:lipid II:glycine glycyltransferase (peptidoglycan interpeptide bridge formation enzyme)